MTQPPKSLDVPRISAQQPSRSRRKRHHPPVSAAATSESRKNRKGRGVCAGHLNGESPFDFILWRGSLDQGKGPRPATSIRDQSVRQHRMNSPLLFETTRVLGEGSAFDVRALRLP